MLPLYITLAFLLDLVAGDPKRLPHPVRLIGKAVSLLESALIATARRPARDLAAGTVLAVSITISVYLASYLFIQFAYRYLGGMGGAAAAIYLAYTTISVKGLADAARDVLLPLDRGDMEAARKALSMVVGRDTAGLSENEISRAAVETVAENTSDGIAAPLFYLALGGPPLALAYKAVNTMDSMVGYKSGKYLYFGRAAARLDDLANFVPARLTGILIVAASGLLSMSGGGYSMKESWRVFVRDRKEHSSPNSGHPEAAAAGALRVRLGGESSYFGVKVVKPSIGDPVEPLSARKVKDAVRLMYTTSGMALAVALVLSYFIHA